MGLGSGHSPKLLVLFFPSLFIYLFKYTLIYFNWTLINLQCSFLFYLTDLFISGCAGSTLLGWLFLSLWRLAFPRCMYAPGWLLLLQSVGSRQAGFSSRSTWAQQFSSWAWSTASAVVPHELSCSTARWTSQIGIESCLLHCRLILCHRAPTKAHMHCSCIND